MLSEASSTHDMRATWTRTAAESGFIDQPIKIRNEFCLKSTPAH